jgi:hypothetical protein
MRWLVGLTLALAAAVAGCKQYCFVHECDVTGPDYYKRLLLPEGIDCDPATSCRPAYANEIPTPPTYLHPDRPIHYISLQECLAIALEQGTINQSPALVRAPILSPLLQSLNDTLIQFTAFRAVSGITDGIADSIRVLALEPAINGTDIESALSRFDAHWSTAVTWNNTDNPSGAGLFSGSSFNQQNGMASDWATGIIKPLPTGGIAGITFNTSYNLFSQPAAGTINPQYRPTLQFAFEQPLLQAFGVEANQLRQTPIGPTNPAFSQFIPGLARSIGIQPSQEGILVTRIRFDQSRADFERQVQILVLNVESAYWDLYQSYGVLYTQTESLRQAYETLKIFKARYDAGTLAPEDYFQTLGQYHLFRSQRVQAIAGVLEAERVLRGILGLPMSDGCRLVPCDAPTLAPYSPDWCTALHEALTLKPELVLAREELKARQLEVINRKNQLLPDLRFTSDYDITGIGPRLDGPNGAFHSLASNHFDNWRLGLELDVPIGFREQHANLRIARLNLARGYHVLRDQEYRVTRLLTEQFQAIEETYNLIRIRRAERDAYGQELIVLYRQRDAGKEVTQRLLEAQRFYNDALVSEYQSIGLYNSVLAGFEYAKGTILQHDSVIIGEGSLPRCAAKRAVEHERERTAALVLRERDKPLDAHGDSHVVPAGGPAPGPEPKLPVGPEGTQAPALPNLIHDQQPVPELTPEMLPKPRPADRQSSSGRLPTPGTLPATGLPTENAPIDRPLQGEPLIGPAQPWSDIKVDRP